LGARSSPPRPFSFVRRIGERQPNPPNKYPATANIRGTIEFDPPLSGLIGALGIRATGQAFTTLPALLK
jgi:hypothetical protein